LLRGSEMVRHHRNPQYVEDMHGSATCSQNIRRILNPKITGRIPANILTSVGGQRSDLMSLKGRSFL
jgi:hypothetical protein